MRPYRKWVFPFLALWLWISFLVIDILGTDSSVPVKFASICLCAFTALIGANSRDALFVAAAQCFTLCADWFLLVEVENGHYLTGVSVFIVVQLIYMVRLYTIRGRNSKLGPILRAVAIAGGLYICSMIPLAGLVLIYFVNLCVNALEAFAAGERVFGWGLCLFICCDICVGLWNLGLFFPTDFTYVGMWFFYLPSQVLIVLSAHRKGE